MNDAVSAYGVIVNVDGYAPDALVAHIRRIEDLGFESVWITDMFGRDVYLTAGYLLANTERIKVGSGIAPIYGRDATAGAQARARSTSSTPGASSMGSGCRTRRWPRPTGTRGRTRSPRRRRT